eukprot:scaffold236852_cov51-Prasinocladus_malaysianus.AAC.1
MLDTDELEMIADAATDDFYFLMHDIITRTEQLSSHSKQIDALDAMQGFASKASPALIFTGCDGFGDCHNCD